MSESLSATPLARALLLSHDLLAAAEQGDVRAVVEIDAARLRLLHSLRLNNTTLAADQRSLLEKIGMLNDRAIGLLEHRRRRTERQMDTAAAGRRALSAYAVTGASG